MSVMKRGYETSTLDLAGVLFADLIPLLHTEDEGEIDWSTTADEGSTVQQVCGYSCII